MATLAVGFVDLRQFYKASMSALLVVLAQLKADIPTPRKGLENQFHLNLAQNPFCQKQTQQRPKLNWAPNQARNRAPN